jgi:hypothetical protein
MIYNLATCKPAIIVPADKGKTALWKDLSQRLPPLLNKRLSIPDRISLSFFVSITGGLA